MKINPDLKKMTDLEVSFFQTVFHLVERHTASPTDAMLLQQWARESHRQADSTRITFFATSADRMPLHVVHFLCTYL